MNTHLDDGQIRAALDSELEPEALQHLEQCAVCQTRRQNMQAQVESTGQRLAFLSEAGVRGEGLKAPAALERFYHEKIDQKEIPVMKRLLNSNVFRFAAVIVILLALIVAIPSTRALADQLLSLFRVQQVMVVPVDFTGMQQLTGNSAFGKQISELLSSSTTMTQKPGDPISASDASQASQLAGFNVRLPQGMTPSQIYVQPKSAFTFKVDRSHAQALLNEAGRSDLVLPASIDGADISVNIPAGATAGYGTCPSPSSSSSSGFDGRGSNGRRYADCIILAEIPSPTVSAPSDVNVAQLAEIALEFTGMSRAQAAAFAASVDWTSSLVIPIPKNAATYEQVQVDGVTGTLIQRPADDAPQFALIWVKDGIIYAIGGLGSNSQQALQMAEALP